MIILHPDALGGASRSLVELVTKLLAALPLCSGEKELTM